MTFPTDAEIIAAAAKCDSSLQECVAIYRRAHANGRRIKMTRDEIAACQLRIAEMRATGWNWCEIAKKFDASRPGIRDFARRPLPEIWTPGAPLPVAPPRACLSSAEAEQIRRRALTAFAYDPDAGTLTHLAGRRAGKIAGKAYKSGYLQVDCAGRSFRAHRLIWLMHYGVWPDKEIDHINRIRTDNRILNLRLADRVENARRRGRKATARSGFKGVYWANTQKSWGTCIAVNNKTKYLGYYPDPVEAARAYDRAALELHGEFACTNEMLGLLPSKIREVALSC